MRISDWSSDVCSSDLPRQAGRCRPDRSSRDRPSGRTGRLTCCGRRWPRRVGGVKILLTGDSITAALRDPGDPSDLGDGYVARVADALPGHKVLNTGINGHKVPDLQERWERRSEEHTSELQSLMRISYAVFCLKKKQKQKQHNDNHMTKNR